MGSSAQAYFDIPIPFSKFFQLNSTDGSKLFIDDALVFDHPGLHDFTGSKTQKWPLNGPKRFKFTVQYFKVSNPVCTSTTGSLRCAAICRVNMRLAHSATHANRVLQGAIPTGTGLVVSWGDLRQLYPNPIPSSELKLRPCSAAVPAPSPTPAHNGHREHHATHPRSI